MNEDKKYSKIYNIVENYINKEYIEELKDFYNHIKDFFNSNQLKEIDFNYFKGWIIETIINGYNSKSYYYELLNGDIEYDNYYYNELDFIIGNIKEYNLNFLLVIINKKYELYKIINSEYMDTEYIIEDIMYTFNWNKSQYDKYTSYCSSYMGSLDLSLVEDLDNLMYWNKKNINKVDIEEHLYYNLDIREIFNIFVIEKVYKGYDISQKDIKKVEDNLIKTAIFELKLNLIVLKKELKKCIYDIQQINKNNCGYELLEKEIQNKKDKIKEIQEVLKNE